MGVRFLQVLLCMMVICGFIEESYGLMCLRCESKTVNGTCKNSRKFHISSKRHQSCYGRRPKCYARATVDEMGNAHFERGCTLKNICNENVDIKYCSMCNSKFCNYQAMVLDQQVKDFARQVRNSKRFHKTSQKKTINVTKVMNVNQPVSSNISETKKDPISVYQTPSMSVLNSVPANVPEKLNETRPKHLTEDSMTSVPTNVSKTMTLTESENRRLSENASDSVRNVASETADNNHQIVSKIVIDSVPVNVSEYSNHTIPKAPFQTKSDDISEYVDTSKSTSE
nr:uncharacterized protein LOC111514381 [Leptinotarsa decemlineata]